MGRQLRMRLDNLRPGIEMRYKDQLYKQACRRNKNKKSVFTREFVDGDKVLVRNYLSKEKWVPGTVVGREGSVNYKIQVREGVWKRHIEQIILRLETEETRETERPMFNSIDDSSQLREGFQFSRQNAESDTVTNQSVSQEQNVVQSDDSQTDDTDRSEVADEVVKGDLGNNKLPEMELRSSKRKVKPPARYMW